MSYMIVTSAPKNERLEHMETILLEAAMKLHGPEIMSNATLAAASFAASSAHLLIRCLIDRESGRFNVKRIADLIGLPPESMCGNYDSRATNQSHALVWYQSARRELLKNKHWQKKANLFSNQSPLYRGWCRVDDPEKVVYLDDLLALRRLALNNIPFSIFDNLDS